MAEERISLALTISCDYPFSPKPSLLLSSADVINLTHPLLLDDALHQKDEG